MSTGVRLTNRLSVDLEFELRHVTKLIARGAKCSFRDVDAAGDLLWSNNSNRLLTPTAKPCSIHAILDHLPVKGIGTGVLRSRCHKVEGRILIRTHTSGNAHAVETTCYIVHGIRGTQIVVSSLRPRVRPRILHDNRCIEGLIHPYSGGSINRDTGADVGRSRRLWDGIHARQLVEELIRWIRGNIQIGGEDDDEIVNRRFVVGNRVITRTGVETPSFAEYAVKSFEFTDLLRTHIIEPDSSIFSLIPIRDSVESWRDSIWFCETIHKIANLPFLVESEGIGSFCLPYFKKRERR